MCSKLNANSSVLHVLTGPTAVGKTELALRWAEANHAEIVSCDSLLFYRGMDIGTAKPTKAELARVPHHLVDICDVQEPMDITRYVALARASVNDIVTRGRRVLVTGGSGFYLKAFFAPVADGVAVSAEIRAEVSHQLKHKGLPALVERLRKLNPNDAATLGGLDLVNPRRVTRALERCLASGKTLGELTADFARLPSPFAEWQAVCVQLEREPSELDARIAQRVDAMLASGLIEEVERLSKLGIQTNPSAARAIGYRETLAMLEAHAQAETTPSDAARAALAAEIVRNTRALVRKQRTWFRTQIPVHRVLSASDAKAETLFS